MKRLNINKNKGITLIALVITIIVLLILAGVSIAMLTGENGILSQAQKAGEQTDIGKEKEDIALAYNGAKTKNRGGTVDADDLNKNFGYNDIDAEASGSNPITVRFNTGRKYTIDENGVISGPIGANIIASIKIEGEKSEGTPPMPSDDFSYVTGTVDDGYVIKDGKGNEYVWVPVDKNQKIKVNVTSKEDITSITLIDPYGSTILEQTNKGTTYTNDNIEPTINGPYILKVKTANEEKTTILGVRSLYAQDTGRDWMTTEEYVKSQGFDTLEEMYSDRGYETEEEFLMNVSWMKDYSETEDYKESVNQNGGFYIGRYEASYENGKPASKVSTIANYGSEIQNGKLITNVWQPEALSLATSMYSGEGFTSSLLTGSAWNRTLGWLEETGTVTSFEIVGDSKTWGNYKDDTFSGTDDLINTGSKRETEKNHIFDLAGNVWEWTTEEDKRREGKVARGGDCKNGAYTEDCFSRYNDESDFAVFYTGFRLALYL